MENQPQIALRWTPRTARVLIATGVGFLGSVLIGLAMGGFVQFMIFGLTFVLGLALAFLLGVISIVMRFRQGESARQTSAQNCRGALLLTLCVVAQFGGLLAGMVINEIHVDNAMHWCEGLGPRLEAWRERTGEYPKELSELGNDLDPPRFCRHGLIYHPSATGYVIDFDDESSLFSGYAYNSESRTWSHYD